MALGGAELNHLVARMLDEGQRVILRLESAALLDPAVFDIEDLDSGQGTDHVVCHTVNGKRVCERVREHPADHE